VLTARHPHRTVELYLEMTEWIEWFIERQDFLRSYDSAPRPPPPPTLSQSSCESPVQLTAGRSWGGGGRRAESYDRKKVWPSINCSILSGCIVPVCQYKADMFMWGQKERFNALLNCH